MVPTHPPRSSRPVSAIIRLFVRWCLLLLCFLWVSCLPETSSFPLRNTSWSGADPLSGSSVGLRFTVSTVSVTYGTWTSQSNTPYSYNANTRQGSITLNNFTFLDGSASADVIWLLNVASSTQTMRLLVFSDQDRSRQELILGRS